MTTRAYSAKLGLFSGSMLVVGGIIGSGIFRSPSEVAARVGTPTLTLTAWGLGALVALIGAFIYGELGARMPRAGGTYVYLRESFGTLPAFLYGWALFFMIGSGAIAAVAVTGANYTTTLLGIDPSSAKLIAAAIVIVLTAINIAGVEVGAITGNILTLLKLGAIAALVFAAFFLAPVHAAEMTLPTAELTVPSGAGATFLALSAALVPVLFAFGGWQQTNAVAEELVEPERTLPRALIVGVIIVVAAYLLINVAYLRALGVNGLAASEAPAADAMALYIGTAGRSLIAAGIVVSTVGFTCVVILMSARVYQAMAADGLFFARMAELHPRTRTPVVALVAQLVVVLVLLFSGSYGQLLDWVVFADWIFFGATAVTLFVWRARDRKSGAPPLRVKTPLHPFSTLIFIACAIYVMIGAITSNPANALNGAIALAVGVPVYGYWARMRSR
jgi:APA family basic amino acid/polyamine antiporter